MERFSFQNIIDGGGIGLSITGMLIVFSGLAFISIFIAFLPRLLNAFDRLVLGKKEVAAPSAPVSAEVAGPEEEEIMAAITLAIHMELERSTGDSQRITIAREQRQGSIWASAGKMRSLSKRSIHA